MTATAFDTLQAASTLEKAGFDKAQADAVVATVAAAVGESFAAITRNMSTKDQVAATGEGLRAESAELRSEMRIEIAKLRSEMAELRAETAIEFKVFYRHLWVMSAGIVGLTVTLVKVIP